jgi:hypothetical protein
MPVSIFMVDGKPRVEVGHRTASVGTECGDMQSCSPFTHSALPPFERLRDLPVYCYHCGDWFETDLGARSVASYCPECRGLAAVRAKSVVSMLRRLLYGP